MGTFGPYRGIVKQVSERGVLLDLDLGFLQRCDVLVVPESNPPVPLATLRSGQQVSLYAHHWDAESDVCTGDLVFG